MCLLQVRSFLKGFFMSENDRDVLESGESVLQIGRDIEAGRRNRKFRAKFRVLAGQKNIDADAAWDYLGQVLTGACNTELDKKVLAGELGIDWAGLTEFMEALAPIILEMMAACG
jgi:hypothetical protein